jgi:hypothetical protein
MRPEQKINVEITSATMEDVESLATIQKQAFKRLYDIYQDEGSPYLRSSPTREPKAILLWSDSEKHISRLINGEVQLTPEVAVRLEIWHHDLRTKYTIST